ncbi:MAG: flippase-like domain-containing protein [Anaerolineae bacterium]|nr:flippase-like domain-containing protein [Anaerolineae bacterium]
MNKLYRKFAIGLALGFAVFLGLMLYGDIKAVGQLLQSFRWRLLPFILGLTMFNYLLRGVRFHYYLRQIGLKRISFGASLRVFIGGFALTITPGKVGELVRVLWLKNIAQANPAQTAPATIIDRMADALAMAILALLGALVYPQYRPAVLSILAGLLLAVIISQIRPLALWLLRLGERLPGGGNFVRPLRTLYESTFELLRFKNLMMGTSIGLVSWSAEGLAFYLVLRGLDAPGSFDLALIAIFILALGSILGGASTLPGGLGAAEATMTVLLQTLTHLPETAAVTATLLIRFFTLWFGVTLGILTIALWHKLLFGSAGAEPSLDPAVGQKTEAGV